MSMYQNQQEYDCNCSCSGNIVSGNSLDLDVNYCESEIRADIVVEEHSSVRLWGRIVNCDDRPVANALVKLLKVECRGAQTTYKGIAHTVSDCEGFYQFELCACEEDANKSCYKLLVSKAAYGSERIIPLSGGNCNPCDPCDGYPFDPCQEYPPIMTPPGDVGNGGHCCDDSSCGCNTHYSPKPKHMR